MQRVLTDQVCNQALLETVLEVIPCILVLMDHSEFCGFSHWNLTGHYANSDRMQFLLFLHTWHKNDLALLHSNTAAYWWQETWNRQKPLSQAFKSNTHISNDNSIGEKKSVFKKISALEIFHYNAQSSYKKSIPSLNMKLAVFMSGLYFTVHRNITISHY